MNSELTKKIEAVAGVALEDPLKIAQGLYDMSATMKLHCGIANNAALIIMVDALDVVRKHPRYKHRAKQLFKESLRLRDAYERRLRFDENGFFAIKGLPAHVRELYADGVGMGDYFDFWAGLGSRAYVVTKPFVSALTHKYYRSLVAHGVKDAEYLAIGLSACAALALAGNTYDMAIRNECGRFGVPERIGRKFFADFSLRRVELAWAGALAALEPRAVQDELSEEESRNIYLSIDDIESRWHDFDNYKATMGETADAFSDMFRSDEARKIVMRATREMHPDDFGIKSDLV